MNERFAMFPVVLLDKISSDYVLRIPGNDVLTTDIDLNRLLDRHYIRDIIGYLTSGYYDQNLPA